MELIKWPNGWIWELGGYLYPAHCGLKVSRSQAKIDDNFANYFFKTIANNKYKWVGAVKSKPKA